MRVRCLTLSMAILAPGSLLSAQQPLRSARCSLGIIEGQVRAGSSFVHPLGSGLEVMLEALPSGWILRVLPQGKPRPTHDYAELATPPYHSVSPLLISTDFSFRAQDAIGWNPRRFRFASDAESFTRLVRAYELYEAKPGALPVSQQDLSALVSQSPAANLTILDAHFVPGTGDQPASAATLATHLPVTAHTMETPVDGKSTSLGRITWIRFRVGFDLPRNFRPDQSVQVEQLPCGQM